MSAKTILAIGALVLAICSAIFATGLLLTLAVCLCAVAILVP